MNDEKIFKARLEDLANKSYKNNIYTYTNFLTPAELSILNDMRADLQYAGYTLYGEEGILERRMVRFGLFDILGYEEPWPIKVVKVEPLAEKFADKLNHRDFLGSIMNLGIERNILGDILVKDDIRAYIYCNESIADFIADNLTKIKHTNVKTSILDVDDDDLAQELKPTLVDIDCCVAAARFDAVVAAVTKVSRNEAHNLFRSGKVTRNGMICENNSAQLKEGDIFAVRGYGKFIYEGAGSTTRKGRLYVHLKQYQ